MVNFKSAALFLVGASMAPSSINAFAPTKSYVQKVERITQEHETYSSLMKKMVAGGASQAYGEEYYEGEFVLSGFG